MVAEEAGTAGRPPAMPKEELQRLIRALEKEMKRAAQALEFEKAAALRDQIFELREQLRVIELAETPPEARIRRLVEMEQPEEEPDSETPVAPAPPGRRNRPRRKG
jgi:excinuclease ABC subunit B